MNDFFVIKNFKCSQPKDCCGSIPLELRIVRYLGVIQRFLFIYSKCFSIVNYKYYAFIAYLCAL